MGGLIGNNKLTGEISASYATGTASGGSNVGGLIGLFEGGSINASYWDTRTSGHSTGVLPFGRTTSQLQSPRSYSGIYGSWNVDVDEDNVNHNPWDFGHPASTRPYGRTWMETTMRRGRSLAISFGPDQL